MAVIVSYKQGDSLTGRLSRSRNQRERARPARRSRDGDASSGGGKVSGPDPGSIEPRIDGWLAPVAAVTDPGRPFQVR